MRSLPVRALTQIDAGTDAEALPARPMFSGASIYRDGNGEKKRFIHKIFSKRG